MTLRTSSTCKTVRSMARWRSSLLVCSAALLVLNASSALATTNLVRKSKQQQRTTYRCPIQDEETFSFSLSEPTVVTLKKTAVLGVLCTLSLQYNGNGNINSTTASIWKPVARSYDGNSWERSGGSFAASLPEWTCNLFGCQAQLPAGPKYILTTRRLSSIVPKPSSATTQSTTTTYASNSSSTGSTKFKGTVKRIFKPLVKDPLTKAAVARFLQTASFGPTIDDLEHWGDLSFATYIQQQVAVPATYHREYFRRRANPHWLYDHPEFAAQLDPCSSGVSATWRRHVLTVKDAGKTLHVRRVLDRWEVSIDGHVRSMPLQLRLKRGRNSSSTLPTLHGSSYQYCASNDETLRGIYKIMADDQCQELVASDLMLDFPSSYTPPSTSLLQGRLPPLNNTNAWQSLPHSSSTEYLSKLAINASRCVGLAAAQSSIPPAPIFAQTVNGVWLQFDPRIQIKDGSIQSGPMADGGASSWLANRTMYCSNVPRSFVNEDTCVLSTTMACRAGSTNKGSVGTGVLLCGSPGEVANDPGLFGDTWLDVSSITISRKTQTGITLPVATTTREAFARQRETIWSDVVLNAPDQLRQRMALALLHIFALPKTAIVAEEHHTEYFLHYYDIFVRHALGNYRNVLREVTYSPLMAESLTYLFGKAASVQYTRTKSIIYPDENYSRELMQLFTIGLVELNMDGSAVLGPNNKTMDTYDTNDIMSFARVWTGFERNAKRANIEGTEILNRIDPLKIEPAFRDKFPKSDLYDGFIGDDYPLCQDLPPQPFLRIGAKYRLLGTSPVPESYQDDWPSSSVTKRLQLRRGSSGLFEKLCASTTNGAPCTFPAVVVLEQNLNCVPSTEECKVDTVRVVQVDNVFYEHVHQPCVQFSFYNNAVKVAAAKLDNRAMCANPILPTASAACCEPNGSAKPWCSYAGERMTRDTAKARCQSIGKTLCDVKNVTTTPECPHEGFRWTNVACKLKVKVRLDGQAAIVHDLPRTPTSVARSTQNFFMVQWANKLYPNPANNCGSGVCQRVDDACLCDIAVTEAPVFTALPKQAAEVLEKLRVGHPGPSMYNDKAFVTKKAKDYTYHSSSQSCCGSDTVFEVLDPNGQVRFLKNVQSTVKVAGTTFQFRNPPQFNSLLSSELSVVDAQHETEALLDHLFYHKNTPPFVAFRFIQRFGVSNPSPRYILAAATAFRKGVYSNSQATFGTGKYGDLQATIAAILLDREAQSPILDNDPSYGSLREPILKVMGFLRATRYASNSPLIELDLMDEKIGQMAYEQTSVFSFFRPQYSPAEMAGLGLAAPEAEVMSSGRVVGLLNGLFSVVKHGLSKCDVGFGVYGDCSLPNSTVIQNLKAVNRNNNGDKVNALSDLLTGGRLGTTKLSTITSAMNAEKDVDTGLQLALQLILASPEFHSTSRSTTASTTRVVQQAPVLPTKPKLQQPGYKVVIHLALVGGCDSFNVLVPNPSSCSTLFEEYTNMRGSIALTASNLLPLDGTSLFQPCSSFAVHHKLPFVQQLYNDQDLLFMANVGVLTEPCNRTNAYLKTETQLFAHNTMQEEINNLDPFNEAAGTSQLGRMVDVLQTNGYSTGRTAVESTPASLAGTSITAPSVVTLDQNGVQPFNVNPSSPAMSKLIAQLNGIEGVGGSKSGVYGEVWSALLQRSLNQTEDLAKLLNAQKSKTAFPTSSLGKRLELVAQLIASRQERGVDRDVFFVPFDGFDSHSDVRSTLETKFVELNAALECFVAELKQLGVWDNVVIVQTSDFGRTLTENTSGGTDHGWGGHYWMAGGAVKGQRIVGSYPATLYPNGASSLDRGRFIPSTSWDAIFNGVADWVGVDTKDDLDAVLPNRNKFKRLFVASDLFCSVRPGNTTIV